MGQGGAGCLRLCCAVHLTCFIAIRISVQTTGRTRRLPRAAKFEAKYQEAVIKYLTTPWCRVLLEKLTGLQLVKKFPSISRNPKVHYRTHKRPPPVSILGQPNPAHIPTSHLLEIYPNIIHPFTPRSPQWYKLTYLLTP